MPSKTPLQNQTQLVSNEIDHYPKIQPSTTLLKSIENHNTRILPIQESMEIIQIKSPTIYKQYQLEIIKTNQ
jgi:hypothetical protein